MVNFQSQLRFFCIIRYLFDLAATRSNENPFRSKTELISSGQSAFQGDKDDVTLICQRFHENSLKGGYNY